MEDTIIVFLLVTLIVIYIVSESRKLTCSSSIIYIGRTISNWVKSILPKNECRYPTGIGYDSNGCFCPSAVEKEFEDLGQILDGLYLSNHTYSNELFSYAFKFARIKDDMNGLELYDYADKRVLAIVQKYLHRLGNNRVSDNISAISISDTDLTVYLARNRKGEEYNYSWRNSQRYAFNEKAIDAKKDRGPIEISWEES